MRLLTKLLISIPLFFVFSLAICATETTTSDQAYQLFIPQDIKWVDGPPGLPKDIQMAVLEGDPSKEGSFTIRLKIPKNGKIMSHTHPGFEHITVISGDFYVGFEDKIDEKKSKKLPVGSFVLIKPDTTHFAFVHGPAIIQLNGIGPWGINYTHSHDDPRNQ